MKDDSQNYLAGLRPSRMPTFFSPPRSLIRIFIEYMTQQCRATVFQLYFSPLRVRHFFSLPIDLQRVHIWIASHFFPMEGRYTLEQYWDYCSTRDKTMRFVAPEARIWRATLIGPLRIQRRVLSHMPLFYVTPSSRVLFLRSPASTCARICRVIEEYLGPITLATCASYHILRLPLPLDVACRVFPYAEPHYCTMPLIIRIILNAFIYRSFLHVAPCRHDPHSSLCPRCQLHVMHLVRHPHLWRRMIMNVYDFF